MSVIQRHSLITRERDRELVTDGEVHIRWLEIAQEAYKEYTNTGYAVGFDLRNWLVAEIRLVQAKIRAMLVRKTREGAVTPLRVSHALLLIVETIMNGEKTSDVRKVLCTVKDLRDELVGYIEAPESGPLRVKLNGKRWKEIEEAINKDVEQGKQLMGPDRALCVIIGSSEAELKVVMHAIQVLSRRQLRVAPVQSTANTA